MISVERVTKRFGDLVAVDALSFDIAPGEVVGFLGPNGAGKTTTMRVLTGTLQPDRGRVLIDGRSIGDDEADTKRRIGYLPESNPLYEDMLVSEYLEYAGRLRALRGRELSAAIRDAAEETDLGDVFFRPIAEASKGYRQRIGLAAAMLHRPDILVLDEPTEGLDPNQRVEIRKLVSALGRERTVLLTTHVMQEVEATWTRLIINNRGSLVADGSVKDLLAGQRDLSTYVVEAAGDGVADGIAALDGVDHATAETLDGRVRVRFAARGAESLGPRVYELTRERGWVLWELHRERASIEDLFRHLTAGSAPSASAPTTESNGATVAAGGAR
jgi:ABC-2 type transport system ATP-binding protein